MSQGIKIAVAASDQLVGIGLVADVPDHTITIQIERLIQSQGELNHAQPWAEVIAAVGDHLEMTLSDLRRDFLKLACAEAMQLVGMRQIAQVHGLSTDLGNLRALPAVRGSVRLSN